MERIEDELAARFHLPPIEQYRHSERDYYSTFLVQSDYVVTKAAEAQIIGESVEPYTPVVNARKFAREMINEIDNGTYTGAMTATAVPVVEGEELSSGVLEVE